LAPLDLLANFSAFDVFDRAHQHRPDSDNYDRAISRSASDRHDRSPVLAEHVESSWLIDRLWVHGVVSAGDLFDVLNDAGDWGVPPVVVLRRKSVYQDGPSVELFGKLLVAEESREGKTSALDPILGCEIDGREGREPAIGHTGGNKIVGGLIDGSSRRFDLAGKELIEVGILRRVGLDHVGEGSLEVEASNEGDDVVLGGGAVVLLAHLDRLLLEEPLRLFPMQGSLLSRPVVQEMHADPHIHAHSLEDLLSRLSVDHIVTEMELVLEVLELGARRRRGEMLGQPGMGLLVACRCVKMPLWRYVVICSGISGQRLEGTSSVLETSVIQVGGCVLCLSLWLRCHLDGVSDQCLLLAVDVEDEVSPHLIQQKVQTLSRYYPESLRKIWICLVSNTTFKIKSC
jgi:hypothetical protein